MPRLTDAEKQDVIRHLEADKPLDDKYRFLLFDDKREVELVWNGKTADVCTIVLPFQTILSLSNWTRSAETWPLAAWAVSITVPTRLPLIN